MLNKNQKIKIITDVYNGRITPKIINILNETTLVIRPAGKGKFKKQWNLSDAEFEAVYHYIDNLCAWHIIKPNKNDN
jgi:hypothetical protein